MLSVRLQRVGRKNDPSFRMVIIDSKRSVKSANYIEMVGSYNARQKTVDLNKDRIKHWIGEGAKPTDTVHNILINNKVIEGKKVNPLGKKTPIVAKKKEEESSEEAEAPKADEGAEEKPAEAIAETDESKSEEESEVNEKKEEIPVVEDKKEESKEESEAKKEDEKPEEEGTPKDETKEEEKKEAE